jgi:hypothetical protein
MLFRYEICRRLHIVCKSHKDESNKIQRVNHYYSRLLPGRCEPFALNTKCIGNGVPPHIQSTSTYPAPPAAGVQAGGRPADLQHGAPHDQAPVVPMAANGRQ